MKYSHKNTQTSQYIIYHLKHYAFNMFPSFLDHLQRETISVMYKPRFKAKLGWQYTYYVSWYSDIHSRCGNV